MKNGELENEEEEEEEEEEEKLSSIGVEEMLRTLQECLYDDNK